MPELRQDPVSSRWVIISAERGRQRLQVESAKATGEKFCPFCYGHEDKTPPEILAYREPDSESDGPGWWIRVVPNKFPALEIEGELEKQGEGIYDTISGVGAHEVIIETPDHFSRLEDLEPRFVGEVLWAYRDRIRDLRNDPRLKYIMVFKNCGESAGASLEHPHSQLIATPIVPKRVAVELAGSQRYYRYKERCVFCDIIRQEEASKERVIGGNDGFIAISPFAARFPFEAWILPRKHSSEFDVQSREQIDRLAVLLKETLLRMSRSLNYPPYNFMLHISPLQEGNLNYYHWHLEVIPHLTSIAGFEWGTGFHINPTPPEEAAAYLRSIDITKSAENAASQAK